MMKLELDPKPRTLAQFAWFAVIGLPLLAAMVLRFATGLKMTDPAIWTHRAMLATAGVAVLQLVAFLAGFRQLSKALYAGLMIVFFPVGFVVSLVLLTVIYFLVITPLALVFRLIGRDALGRKPDPSRASYWRDRGEPRAVASYFKLY